MDFTGARGTAPIVHDIVCSFLSRQTNCSISEWDLPVKSWKQSESVAVQFSENRKRIGILENPNRNQLQCNFLKIENEWNIFPREFLKTRYFSDAMDMPPHGSLCVWCHAHSGILFSCHCYVACSFLIHCIIICELMSWAGVAILPEIPMLSVSSNAGKLRMKYDPKVPWFTTLIDFVWCHSNYCPWYPEYPQYRHYALNF